MVNEGPERKTTDAWILCPIDKPTPYIQALILNAQQLGRFFRANPINGLCRIVPDEKDRTAFPELIGVDDIWVGFHVGEM